MAVPARVAEDMGIEVVGDTGCVRSFDDHFKGGSGEEIQSLGELVKEVRIKERFSDIVGVGSDVGVVGERRSVHP